MITFQCQSCGAVFRVADSSGGKPFQCRMCSGSMTIPSVSGPIIPGAEMQETTEPPVPVSRPIAYASRAPGQHKPFRKSHDVGLDSLTPLMLFVYLASSVGGAI